MKVSIITATYNRPEKLSAIALPSLLNQTDKNFEWVVINDGANPQTREIIHTLSLDFPIVYLEIAHPSSGFGLCYARNLGIESATKDLISYLDDDNTCLALPHLSLNSKKLSRNAIGGKPLSPARPIGKSAMLMDGAALRDCTKCFPQPFRAIVIGKKFSTHFLLGV